MTRVVGLLSLLAASSGSAWGEGAAVSGSATFDRTEALALSQAAIGREVVDQSFRTTGGTMLSLADLRGKPVVISLIFTSCYHICPATTQHLAKVVRKARDVLGDDSFHVLTIGFDAPNDDESAMRVFAAQQSVDLPGWDFLSGDQAVIDALPQISVSSTSRPPAGSTT